MPNKQYPDVAAARHLREMPQGPNTRSNGAVKPARAARRRPVAAIGGSPRKDKGYQKKRIVALVLSVTVALSVPGLVALLVYFG
ncbi:hypothetical protein LJ756_00170 [Arthrobacter sp. zg-Y411]|uniref:hypothetical protein n=1 Tax=Arthrobacter zhangbolii TaxID=2886936 RepID=UPI001D150A2C|nr:hypothetical protein [Arthrobacter zhangbolii]MCC3293036.1 hypothetical protein [Arthrobacter zhangbolii]